MDEKKSHYPTVPFSDLEPDSPHGSRYLWLRPGPKPNKALIKNIPFLITFVDQDKLKVLQNYSILIENGWIKEVAPSQELTPDINQLDLIYDAGRGGGVVVTPGLINAHAHPPMYLLRGSLSLDGGEELEESLRNMFLLESKMNQEDFFVGALGDLTEQQKNGISTTLSHYGVFQPIDDAAKLCRHNLINALSAVSNSHPENTPSMVKKYLKNSSSYTKAAIALHYPYKASKEQLLEIKKLVQDYGALFTTHAAESRKCEELSFEKHNLSSIGVLKDVGLLSNRTILSHCVHLKEQEIGLCIEKEVGIVHLPTSNLLHKSGLFPFEKWIKKGGLDRLSLGTDSVVSKNSLDVLGEALQASILHKDNIDISYTDLFKMITLGGAKVLDLPKKGMIKKGYIADIAFWKLRDRGFMPFDSTRPRSLVENMMTYGHRNVRDLMINGDFVISNRLHNYVKESLLIEVLQKGHNRLKARV